MTVPFGREFRHKHFGFDPEYIPLNHGSFGASPNLVLAAVAKERDDFRSNPDLYTRYQVEGRLAPAHAEIAKVLDADPLNVAFVTNASIGVNTVLRSLPFKKGDVVVYASTTYAACANTIRFLKELMEIVPVFVKIDYPMSSDEIVDAYAKAIKDAKAQGPVKLGFFDVVSSMPAARLPWERLVALCREQGVLSFVDGAHCIGLLEDVSLNTVRPDFFVTNLHKWFYTPTPASLLYVDQKHHRAVQPFPISGSYIPHDADLSPEAEENLLLEKFKVIGAIDYSHYIAAATAAEFRRDVCGGEHAIISYSWDLARKAADLYAKELNAEILVGGGPEDDLDIRTAMINLYLPFEAYGIPKENYGEACVKLTSNLVHKYKVYVPFSVYNGRPLIRISGQTYLEMADFEDGLKAIKSVIKDYQQDLIPKLKNLSV